MFALLTLGILCSAQEQAAKSYSLHDCVGLALAQQTDILTGQYTVDAARARATQARSDFYPQVGIQTAKNLVQQGNPLNNTDLATSLTVTQNFYDGGLREAKIANAKYAVTQADLTLLRTRQTVTFTVTNAYLELLRAQALAKVASQQVTYIEGQLAQVQARIDAGDAARVDALPIKAQLANARVSELAAKNSIRTASIQLQQAMGLTPSETFVVAEIAPPTKTAETPYEQYLAGALKDRPEIRQEETGINIAKTGVKTAKINMLPRPVVAGQLDQPIGGNDERAYTVSAGIVFNIFDGQNTQAVYREAKANLTSAQVRSAQVPRDVTADVQTAYLSLTDARERMTASTLSLEAAQQNFEAQEGRYQQGMAIPLDLLNAQLNVTTAQSNAVQAQYDYLTALAQLHYATGKEGEVTWE
jgi:outer membrane protein TolC